MRPEQQFCFTHSSGEDIYLFALHNSKGTQVMISNYGAIITSYRLKHAAGEYDIVLGFDNTEDYTSNEYLENYPWFGAAIGRYGNRIKNARFSLDGREYILSKNNNNEQLHGGHEGFDKKAWRLLSSTSNTLELGYTSIDGEEGFPGNLNVTIRFELNEQNELSYEYTATTDQPTIVNLTHHSYFNLENGSNSITEHEIRIPASRMLEQGNNFVATGEIISIKNTPHDFTDWKKISANWDPAHGYDQSFIVGEKTTALKLMGEAYSEKSNLKLQVWSTEPVIHFYSGKWIPRIKGKNGQMYGPYCGFCLETQVHPNAINIPGFPNTVLRPGETYHQKTVYKIYSDSK